MTLTPQWEQTTVLEIAREIADAANMTIVVFTDPISQRLFDKTVDFSGDRLSALAALDLVLRPHGLHFDVREGQIMIGMPGALPIEVTAARYKRPLGGETPLVTQRDRDIPADIAAINAYAWQANMMVDCWVVGDELMITGSPRMHHAIRGLLAGIGESQAVP